MEVSIVKIPKSTGMLDCGPKWDVVPAGSLHLQNEDAGGGIAETIQTILPKVASKFLSHGRRSD